MSSQGMLDFSLVAMVDDVIQQHGKRLSDIDLASRKASEASLRRFEAAGWIRKMIGVVGAKDLPAEPTEDEFRIKMQSGIILCNVLNKIQAGVVPKIVEAPSDAVIIPDGAALSVYQHFENVRNFLVSVERMGIPTFEASDLEQGGKSSRIVNCVLAMKSYSEWKDKGGHGVWKYGGNFKQSPSGKQFVRRNSDAFMNSFLRSLSSEKSLDSFPSDDPEHDLSEMDNSCPFYSLIRKFLSDKRQEEIPTIMENLLSKVTEEFERRLATQNEQMKSDATALDVSCTNNILPCSMPGEMKNDAILQTDDTEMSKLVEVECEGVFSDEVDCRVSKKHVLFEKQNKDLQDLKHTVSAAKLDIQLMQKKYQEEINCLGQHLHSLAHAASGYQKVLEENRKLYNQVQDLKGNIRVYCRVRPFLPGQPNRLSTLASIDNGNITLITPSKNGKEERKSFTYNQVFGPSATQEMVFSDMKPLIRSVLDGYNVCIFAYGQTGSGKTYTMSGPNNLTEDTLGVNYRALEIRNSSQNGLNVPDANLIPVTSTSEVMYLMDLGHKNRAVSSTAMNNRSSRSHSCLTVYVKGRDLTSGTDLRGSLGDVISSLSQKNAHVPYRNSKLTQLLQDALGGQAKTLMFVHISPEPDAIGETISTLKFAERVSTVELGAARANKDSANVKELKEQIASLKAALAKKEGEKNTQKPELRRMLSTGSTTSSSSCQSVEDIEVNDNLKRLQRRKTFDPQDLLKGSANWVDEDMVHKQNGINMNGTCLGQQREEGDHQLPKMPSNKYIPDPSKIYPEQPINKNDILNHDMNKIRYEVATTDESDELDVATTDSSEADFLWRRNARKTTSIPTLKGSTLKTTTLKQAKHPERSLIPQPSARRQSTGTVLATPKNARRPVSGSGDGRRKTVKAKLEKH
ncbi:P-loop nucleoside triphosphate hydrolases superfamily protein with CH (Calponin Homology) domain-containing protein [Heracleum sosnowskyi]|uniref:P-loop nucleoside triphosphate hydrolases superfamily protein with CH (Calponin Homology) domain-containing protein n=1 Tax=Heracleum sosnowskyi TaxID=360622 RepID=A0AAD8MIF2_9APIA|nr:P-loop nucleoside triphosphate hydrolases superfamily protein with CH (Calponin Homology) domain-containing protein [Heracleum sosnowskyi]